MKQKQPHVSACPCGSSQVFETCCGPYLHGKPAPTAEALMRSRYCAFVVGDLEYIEETSAGEARLAFNRGALKTSLTQTEWLGLQILDVQSGQAGDTSGYVTFKVRFRESGRLFSQTERSEFRRVGAVWRYWKGEFDVAENAGSPRNVGRNDPCPCGSGAKFKKCCGA